MKSVVLRRMRCCLTLRVFDRAKMPVALPLFSMRTRTLSSLPAVQFLQQGLTVVGLCANHYPSSLRFEERLGGVLGSKSGPEAACLEEIPVRDWFLTIERRDLNPRPPLPQRVLLRKSSGTEF